MKPELLLTADLTPSFHDTLSASFVVHRGSRISHMKQFLLERGDQIQAAVTWGSYPFSSSLFAAMPKLKVLCCCSAGTEGIDLAAARQHSVPVTSCAGVTSGDVADMAFGLLLAAGRRIVSSDRSIRAGGWTKKFEIDLSRGIWGSKLGILGLGAIGLEVAKRAGGFSMPVFYHNRAPRPDVPYTYVGSASALAEQVDILVVACPSTPATRGLVDAQILRALGPNGIIVNIARGDIVNEAALVQALRDRAIGAAGLDVFAQEPHVPEPLKTMENVVLTPHCSGSTWRAVTDTCDSVLDNLQRAFSGLDLHNRVA